MQLIISTIVTLFFFFLTLRGVEPPLPHKYSWANLNCMLETEVLQLTHPLLHSRNLGGDTKTPVLSKSSSGTLNGRSFQGISSTRGNKSG